jgi:glycine cleavage system regulatory protein
MSGGMLFEAQATLEAPPDTSVDQLRSRLETLADELRVEIRLSDAEGADSFD